MASGSARFEDAAILPGKVYVPAAQGGRKHPCEDCFACQWCADSRCAACRCSGGADACREPCPCPKDQATNR